MLENIRVVLVGSQEPMNVGSVARAMQNFGLSDLRLVAPEPQVERDLGLGPNSWAYRLAVHAEEILERATVVRTPLEALEGVQFVVGTTVRKREIYTGPVVTAREMAPLALHQAQKGKVAILFGRETAGLTTDELDLSQLIVRIPTAPKQPSLNLAQAVMVLSYELFVAAQEPVPSPAHSQGRGAASGHSLASREALEALFTDLGDWVLETGFSDLNRQPYAVRRFRRLLHKANLTPGEVQFLRGFLHQSRWYARQGKREEG